MIYDLCIIGGGIVGLAVAIKFREAYPGAGIVVLEKESGVARHQTGHNSGVIHSGIYYAPGSFRAQLCRKGAAETVAFCQARRIPYDVCGKLLVATDAAELARMDQLFQRASENKVEVERLDAVELRRREPNIAGLGALFVPSTGIVDYAQVCEAMAQDFRAAGGRIEFRAEVTAITETVEYVTVGTAEGADWKARHLIVCGGLQADRLARLAGLPADFQIVPFRGEYYRLPPSRNSIVRALIYPIPDPALPFLGIHLTRLIDGGVSVGPNAVLGWSREGYPKFSFAPADAAAFLRFPGFWRLIAKHIGSGVAELRSSLSKSRYLAECRKYCPSLELADLTPYRAGIRAQAVLRDGTMVHDFIFEETPRMLHVCNAPSPAATSALPIGAMIVERLAKKIARPQ
jgi:(S)-2-hydroxyglutarate dehydrogenase